MTRKIFDTYHAPEEEIEGVKQVLDAVNIPWYETEKGRWWLGSAALWVAEEQHYEPARKVINDFQKIWQENAATNKVNNQKTHWPRIPLVIVAILIILFISAFPFWL